MATRRAGRETNTDSKLFKTIMFASRLLEPAAEVADGALADELQRELSADRPDLDIVAALVLRGALLRAPSLRGRAWLAMLKYAGAARSHPAFSIDSNECTSFRRVQRQHGPPSTRARGDCARAAGPGGQQDAPGGPDANPG